MKTINRDLDAKYLLQKEEEYALFAAWTVGVLILTIGLYVLAYLTNSVSSQQFVEPNKAVRLELKYTTKSGRSSTIDGFFVVASCETRNTYVLKRDVGDCLPYINNDSGGEGSLKLYESNVFRSGFYLCPQKGSRRPLEMKGLERFFKIYLWTGLR